MLEKLRIYIDENLAVENRMLARGMGNYYYSEDNNISYKQSKKINPIQLESAISIQDYVQQKDDYSNFQTMLFKLIDERNLKDSDVYNKVHMDRRLFSKIRNNDYHPSKETIILLGIALELNEKEMIIAEILQAIAGSMGMLLTLPLTSAVCATVFYSKSKEADKDAAC